MSDLVYEAPREYSRKEAAEIFASEDIDSILRLMVGLAYYDPDWKWVQDKCLTLSEHKVFNLRYIAALCFSHLARIHGELDLNQVRPVLLRLENDPEPYVRGMATEAIEDIEHFLTVDLRDASQFN